MAGIHKAKDSSAKIIFGDHGLFAELLRDFIKIDVLKDVDLNDIEDITGRDKYIGQAAPGLYGTAGVEHAAAFERVNDQSHNGTSDKDKCTTGRNRRNSR